MFWFVVAKQASAKGRVDDAEDRISKHWIVADSFGYEVNWLYIVYRTVGT